MRTRILLGRWFGMLRYAHRLYGGLVIAAVLFMFVNGFIFTAFRVDGHSMDETLRDGQFLPVCLACARFIEPDVGDIVIVEYEGESSVRFVKRVLGRPGDSVPYRGNAYTLAENEYFVVGDNRGHSTDSRDYGPVKRERIIGFVIGSYAEGPGKLTFSR